MRPEEKNPNRPAESPASGDAPDAVFATAHLVWLDLESGDELSIELSGPQPFLEDLMAHGFALLDLRTDGSGGTSGRIEATISRAAVSRDGVGMN
jgi:hypothetical protein